MSRLEGQAALGDPAVGRADLAIVAAGYVGLPLAQTFAEAGRAVVLVDVSPDVVAAVNRGESHIEDVSSEQLAPLVREGRDGAGDGKVWKL
jgi:UDP-N-acetyl-D-mannosaminuronate dehydrogenase